MSLKSSVVIFQVLEPLQSHWPHWPQASATWLASPTYTALFHHKTFWSCLFGLSKFANLQKSLGTIIKQIYWSFYPLETFRFVHFNIIWLLPLQWKIGKKFKYIYSSIFSWNNNWTKWYNIGRGLWRSKSESNQSLIPWKHPDPVSETKAIETGMILSIMDMKKNFMCFFIDLYSPW